MPGRAEPDDVPESRPNVYVLQADPAVREQVRGVARSAGLHVRSFSRAEDFLRAVQPDQIGCAVVEAEMPGTNGLEVQHGLAARRIPIPVIMITEPTKLATAIEAIKAGAFDVIEKPYVGARILAAIQAAIAAQQSRRQEQQASGDVRRRYAELTTRERQVLELVAAGFRSREIAARLEIREKTVEVYRSRVNHKMNAHNAAELAQMLHCMKL